MLFNSAEFVLFFLLVFVVFWLLRNLKQQNVFIFIVSYVFYAWWDWRFLALLIATSALNYMLGHRIYTSQNLREKRLFLFVGVAVGIGTLAYFKYTNFFIHLIK